MTEDELTDDIPQNAKPSSDTESPSSPKKPVKSTAVVKYSAVSTPANFAQLQCNTNLNLPPNNWLSTTAESYGLQNVWSRSTGFSSFRMAHMFPDCVGEVDVVSDAENIKKLLKLPYSHGLVSMIVHRVENTLLLDDFDIYKYLLRQSENDWEWLKKFFYEHVFENLGDKEKRLFPKANSRNAIQQKNLISKFLYHSLVLSNNKAESQEKPTLPVKPLFDQPALPEPLLNDEEKLPGYNHNFSRNVVWTFENIQMLVGTDMPIFGGKTHPCISLKLRDASKPINVLTGIDYWLDNLMCNVPEVVMCYHLDGIVQKYELIKTEDLPNLDDAKFSPKVIRDIAQNILSFLKNNATKAGHTYWLFKAKNDDVVKLYDLTSLCNDMSDDRNQNPFTIPVAMLLYRVARNMKYSSDYKKNQGTVRMLLKNCIKLLPKEKYPQIVTSAYYMLADLYIPEDTDPANPNLADISDEVDSECGSNPESEADDEKADQDVNAAIKCLALSNIKEHQSKDKDFVGFKFKPPPVSGTVEERCQSAFEFISSGLKCLKYFPTSKADEDNKSDNKENVETEDQEDCPSMAKPFEAIPMPYKPLNSDEMEVKNNSPENSTGMKRKNKQKKKKSEKSILKNNPGPEDATAKALLCKHESKYLPTWQAPKKDDNHSWSVHLKILLYEKALLIFAVQAENEYSSKNYGSALRHILSSLHCQKILEIFCSIKNSKLTSYLLGRAGDCCFMMVQDWLNIKKHQEDFEVKNVIEDSIIKEVFSTDNFDTTYDDILPENFVTLEAMLVASYKCYENALSLDPMEVDKSNLLRRLGNIHNELGVLYMNQASSRYQQGESFSEISLNDTSSPLIKSRLHLESGVKAFEAVHDEANLALLHSNTGRLMRLRAHINTKQCSEERQFYNKALNSYQKALQVLGVRKTNPMIWDTVTWDLSTTLFTLATLLQDYPNIENKTEEELEREVVEIFQKSLKYCDIETPGPRQPIYQFRAATIQHRLASLYHKVYRESDCETDNVKRKNSLQLSKLYYDKAAKLLLALEQTTEYLTVQMERVALAEYQAQTSNNFIAKFKSYQNCLELILQCKSVIDIIIERNKNIVKKENLASVRSCDNKVVNKNNTKEDKKESNDEKNQIEEEEKLVALLEQRLQFVLRSLIKLFLNKSSGNQKKECQSIYKQCYSLTLHCDSLNGIDLIKHISNVLKKINDILCEKTEI